MKCIDTQLFDPIKNKCVKLTSKRGLELKRLIKEAVKEALQEELAELGKQRLTEQLYAPNYLQPNYLQPNGTGTPYPQAPVFTTANTPLSGNIKQSLLNKMGMPGRVDMGNMLNEIPTQQAPTGTGYPVQQAPASIGNVYTDLLSDVANEIKHDPGQIAAFRNIGVVEG